MSDGPAKTAANGLASADVLTDDSRALADTEIADLVMVCVGQEAKEGRQCNLEKVSSWLKWHARRYPLLSLSARSGRSSDTSLITADSSSLAPCVRAWLSQGLLLCSESGLKSLTAPSTVDIFAALEKDYRNGLCIQQDYIQQFDACFVSSETQ